MIIGTIINAEKEEIIMARITEVVKVPETNLFAVKTVVSGVSKSERYWGDSKNDLDKQVSEADTMLERMIAWCQRVKKQAPQNKTENNN